MFIDQGLSFKVLTFHQNMIPITGRANTDHCIEMSLPEQHLDWLLCLLDLVLWVLSMVIQLNNGSLYFELCFGFVPLHLLSGVTCIALPNDGLEFTVLAFAARFNLGPFNMSFDIFNFGFDFAF